MNNTPKIIEHHFQNPPVTLSDSCPPLPRRGKMKVHKKCSISKPRRTNCSHKLPSHEENDRFAKKSGGPSGGMDRRGIAGGPTNGGRSDMSHIRWSDLSLSPASLPAATVHAPSVHSPTPVQQVPTVHVPHVHVLV